MIPVVKRKNQTRTEGERRDGSFRSFHRTKKNKDGTNMTNTVQNYRNMVEQPWGRMFYELIYRQLNLPDDRRLKILDFGAGFCLTADYYAKYHEVTAVEPNEEMAALRVKENDYTLVPQGAEYLAGLESGTFDVVICHNVLEYVENADSVLRQLVRVLKPGGILSVVKHNLPGKVMFSAVLADDPKAALELLDPDHTQDSPFGTRNMYSNESLISRLGDGMKPVETYGIRAFFGLSSNNEIKYAEEWYNAMLELETRAATMDEYRKIAFSHHLIFQKKS